MSVFRRVIEKVDEFDKALTLSTTPQGEFGWTLTKTAAAGSPTAACVSADDGAFNITLANTSEAEIMTISQDDVLAFRWDSLQYVEFVVSQPVAADAVTTLFFGVSNARNDAVGSITEKALFKVLGSTDTTAIVIDTADTVNTNTGVATANVMSSTPQRFAIDFTDGLAKVKFYIDGARQAPGTTFNLSGMTGGHRCQLQAQLQKASGTGVPQAQISRVYVRYRAFDGV